MLQETGGYNAGIMPESDCPILFLVICSYRDLGSRFVVAGALKDEYYSANHIFHHLQYK